MLPPKNNKRQPRGCRFFPHTEADLFVSFVVLVRPEFERPAQEFAPGRVFF
jgi:hypothetical protein